jgi:hypothetical protein
MENIQQARELCSKQRRPVNFIDLASEPPMIYHLIPESMEDELFDATVEHAKKTKVKTKIELIMEREF